jgi:hypothetical protein
MGRKSEKGEGKLGGLIALIVLLAGGLAAWNVIPVYFDHYDFADKVKEICGTPRYKTRTGDEGIRKMLMDEVTKRRLTQWIGPESFRISTVEGSREIELYYERETEILPGFKKTFKFDLKVSQPLL